MIDNKVKRSSSGENSTPDSSSDIKVSIIIPVYNVEKYLRQCLDSIVNQTLKEIEVICINDGSTDNSPIILEEYEKKDPRIRVITQENMGSGVARNRAIQQAKGKYIGFMDSDDWADPTMFEKLYENAELNNSDIVMCPMLIINESGQGLSRSDKKLLPYYNLDCFDETFDNRVFNYKDTEDFIFEVAVNAYNKIYKTSFVRKYNAKFAEDGLIFQDNIFFFSTYLNASRMTLMRDFLYIHRTNRSGSVQTEKGKKYIDIIKIFNMIIDIFKNSFPEYDEIKLLNRKLIHTPHRYTQISEKYKSEFFKHLKEDFQEINLDDDVVDKLDPHAKANYRNILKSDTYKEFELTKERDRLLNRMNQLKAQNKKLNKKLTEKKNEMAEYLTTTGFVKYKTKNIVDRLKKRIS
ncbi:MAG TPA: glycosyltransferase [Methanobacterium sp.]|jgi:glycosyltransferase involved in cell wall biosynthesis|nr:MAG: glycosyltransferase [Methanobacterium sp.]HOI70926.1 glycosyltransferase [Methanobacterium sp.]